MTQRSPAPLALLLILCPLLWPQEALRAEAAGEEIDRQIAAAWGGTPGEQQAAIAGLRELGSRGLEAMLQAVDAERLQDRNSPESRVLDKVCGQRDCAASRLFWYTDFEEALAEARRLERPILSLRLLGRLDEDLSCANSRFFRTALYPDPAVGRLLRDRFVLHWKSVRPVPKLTVDFGDGRALEGTVAGNSVHYVLDRHGRLIDALPGLYGPGSFATELEAAGELATRAGEVPEESFLHWIRDSHRDRVADLDARLKVSLKALGQGRKFPSLRKELNAFAARPVGPDSPTAREAAVLASSKAITELPALAALDGGFGLLDVPPGEEIWQDLAVLRRQDVRLSRQSQALLLAIQRSSFPETSARILEAFRETMALDTVRNQHLLRRTVHVWLQDREAGLRPEGFDEDIYARLFRTPLTDPWFGLAPADLFTGIQAPSPEIPGGTQLSQQAP